MKQFPEVLYKGNSINVTFNIKRGNEDYVFQVGDVIRVGIKNYIGNDEYILKKDITISKNCESIPINFTHEDTNKIPICKAILEVALQFNGGDSFKTVYQKEIELKGVVIDD